jgi:SAM-dependent methyltransferase/uncharacterized protein YbaR (Trm112 family)
MDLAWSPICLACRTWDADRIELRTVARAGDVMVCTCGKRYPVVDGVPILMKDPAGFLRNEIASVVERDLSPEVQAMLVEGGPDDAAYARLVEHLSIYLDAQWGDRAEPEPDGARWGMQALVERVQARSAERVAMAVELGCSVGRVAAELAHGADVVVGVDLHFGSLRRARRIALGERVVYNRRMVGRHYREAAITADGRRGAVHFVCADALDPPLAPGGFGRVVALNLIDSVRHPRQLLTVMDGLCARGGELVLSSPYAWQSHVMDEGERFGGAEPAADLVARLRDGTDLGARYRIEDEAEVPWTLRRDARSVVSYRAHYVRARKM